MTEFSFTERAPLEAGFSEVFRSRIVPVLARHEATRRTRRRTALRWMAATGAGGLGGLGAAAGAGEAGLGLGAALVGGAGTWGVKSWHESRWQAGLGAEVLPVLCDFLGDMRHGGPGVDLAPFERLGVVPSHHRAALEDSVGGTHRGIDWALSEARLTRRTHTRRGRTRSRTVFRGLLIRIATVNSAPRIYFGRDRGAALNWLSETFSGARAGLERVTLDDPEFEAVYEVYSDEPEAARSYLVDTVPAGLRRVALEEAGGRDYVAAAFEGDGFYLALPRKRDFLRLGSLFTPLTGIEEDLHAALADLDLPRRVIDALTGA